MNPYNILYTRPMQRWHPSLGTIGHLALFSWFFGMVLLVPAEKIMLSAGICILVAFAVYPLSLRQILRWRWLIWMLLMALPSVFFVGELDSSLGSILYSSEGLQSGVQIAVRFIVILIAVHGFTSVVDIPTLAGLLERFELRGLGFSMGVALNMLPYLQESSIRSWQTLRMRGGLRKKRWRALQLLMITIITNALQHVDDVVLAAETRAFSVEKARPMPIKQGNLDWVTLAIGFSSLVLMIWI